VICGVIEAVTFAFVLSGSVIVFKTEFAPEKPPVTFTGAAYLGTGLLGSNFVKAFLKKDQTVHVWNRTYSKAKLLEASGAKAFENIVEAVKGAERIHLTLSDDAAVDATLELARTGFKPGVIIIDHTTTSTKGATERTTYWKQQGFTYLHAPVFMGPPNALDSTGYMLVSGDQDIIKTVEPILSGMTGKLINFGPEINRAAAAIQLISADSIYQAPKEMITLADSVAIKGFNMDYDIWRQRRNFIKSSFYLANAVGPDPAIARIVAGSIGIDTHNHIDVPLIAGELPGPKVDLYGEMKKSG
ncbi:phosphogluconate dehydrogenase, NAD binding domain protein, partial [Ostertagia ostertagi]